MPIVTSGRVLVTGANGFLAIWMVDRLLRQDYAVRAVVRSAAKGVHVTTTFASYGAKLEIVVVEDITVVCFSLIVRSSYVHLILIYVS